MKIQFYPKQCTSFDEDRGFSEQEIRRGHIWVYADITCPHCGKVQPVAATSYLGGPCCKCGKRTDGGD